MGFDICHLGQKRHKVHLFWYTILMSALITGLSTQEGEWPHSCVILHNRVDVVSYNWFKSPVIIKSNETIVDADYIQKFQKRLLMSVPQSSIQNIFLCSKVLCITKP